MRIERYELANYDPWDKCGPTLMQHTNGRFVRYDDVKHLVEAHNAKQPERTYADYNRTITIKRSDIEGLT